MRQQKKVILLVGRKHEKEAQILERVLKKCGYKVSWIPIDDENDDYFALISGQYQYQGDEIRKMVKDAKTYGKLSIEGCEEKGEKDV